MKTTDEGIGFFRCFGRLRIHGSDVSYQRERGGGRPRAEGRRRILVVEDDLLVSEIMEVLLDQLGYETLAVINARQARDALLHDGFIDAVFADLGLADAETGERLLSWVASARPEVLRVLMSGVRVEQDCPSQYVFLLKPFGKQGVLDALETARSIQLPVRGESREKM